MESGTFVLVSWLVPGCLDTLMTVLLQFDADCFRSNPNVVGNEKILSAFEEQGLSRSDAA